jgi:hypothetical protein
VHDPVEDRRHGVTRERLLSGDHLEKDDGQGEQIGTAIHGPTADLLGGHVARRPQHGAVLGHGSERGLGQAEVEDLHPARGHTQEVPRLDVAMDDPCAAVGEVERVRGLGHERHHLREGKARLGRRVGVEGLPSRYSMAR